MSLSRSSFLPPSFITHALSLFSLGLSSSKVPPSVSSSVSSTLSLVLVHSLLSQSRLPVPVLTLVWKVLDLPMGTQTVDRDGFVFICALVAQAQMNREVDEESLRRDVEEKGIQLPRFEGIMVSKEVIEMKEREAKKKTGKMGTNFSAKEMNLLVQASPKQENSGAEWEATKQAAFTDEFGDDFNFPQIPLSAGQQRPKHEANASIDFLSAPMQNLSSSDVRSGTTSALNASAKGQSFAGNLISPNSLLSNEIEEQNPSAEMGESVQQSSLDNTNGVDAWTISEREMVKYAECFLQADVDGDNFVSGPEAKEFFEKSGLSKEQLHQIWILADTSHSNRLSLNEFAVAMHLIMRVRLHHAEIPKSLPPSMLEFAASESEKLEEDANEGIMEGQYEQEMESLRSHYQNEINSSKRHLEVLQQQRNSRKTINRELDADIEEWKLQALDLTSVIDVTRGDLDILQATEDKLKQELQSQRANCKQSELKLKNLNLEYDAIKKNIEELELELKSSIATEKQQECTLQQLHSDISLARTKIDQLSERKTTQHAIVASGKNKTQELLETKTAMISEISDLNEQLASLKTTTQSLKEEASTLTLELQELQQQFDDCNELLGREVAAVSKQKAANALLLETKNKLKQDIKALTSGVYASKSDNAPKIVAPLSAKEGAGPWGDFSVDPFAIPIEPATSITFHESKFNKEPVSSKALPVNPVSVWDSNPFENNPFADSKPADGFDAEFASDFVLDESKIAPVENHPDKAKEIVVVAQEKLTNEKLNQVAVANEFDADFESDFAFPVNEKNISTIVENILIKPVSRDQSPWPASAVDGDDNWAKF